MAEKKKGRILSGMRPTGKLHLGNLFGALDNWVKLQEDYDCYYMVADWHALTTGYEDTTDLKDNTVELVIDWLSAGVDPKKSVIFRQSDVKEHGELYLLFSMITPLGWLERCPTYKEQLRQITGRDITTHGFLGYPVLMAADILVYKSDTIPVGEDQLPHLELTRELARRFNYLYGPVFPEPAPKLNRVTLLLGTDGRKMSKSYGNEIRMSDDEKTVREKVSQMITDPNRIRRKDPGNPEVCSVYTMHRAFAEAGLLDEIDQNCRTAGIGCVDCKKRLADNMVAYLSPIWERRAELEQNRNVVHEILEEGAGQARQVASRTLAEVREAMRI
ncbi:MAG: tryptophan--tRNA ligase [Limnochordia bacterium]|jgi:tryptophanyl-tRNA synthetase|nr:tryptophan--tRNA ligase [Limnochordia bacterium]MDD2630482.1 tryptophan--tRNA ligase [Limnochordia bacterium]MDD4518791.1 tryptophan--tRNA ligase [Limnochordia bacterium]